MVKITHGENQVQNFGQWTFNRILKHVLMQVILIKLYNAKVLQIFLKLAICIFHFIVDFSILNLKLNLSNQSCVKIPVVPNEASVTTMAP